MIRVLFVDDNPDHLSLARLFLERGGMVSVEAVLSGREALVRLDHESYDAVISDFHMPEMDGIALLKAIRQKYPTLPFIILTARDEREIAIEALNNGATFFLKKEGSPRQMFAELDSQLMDAVREARRVQVMLDRQVLERDILAGSPVGVAVFDDKFRCICLNPAWRALVHAVTESAAGMHVRDLVAHVPEQWYEIHAGFMRGEDTSISLEEMLNTGDQVVRVRSFYRCRTTGDPPIRQMIQYLIP